MWNVFISLSTMTDTYNGYSSLKWYLWSLKVCRTTIQAHWLWGSKGTVVCTPCGRQMPEVSPISDFLASLS